MKLKYSDISIQTVFVTILAVFCQVLPMSVTAKDLPVLNIFFDGELDNSEYRYGRMELTDNGRTTLLPAKFKTRGATALHYTMKPSMSMKLRNVDDTEIDSSLLGIRHSSSWILDAMAIDRINMRNRVCMDIWNRMYRLPYNTDFNGRCGTDGRFVEVFVNGIYKGIYCLSDRVNRKLLNLKKTSASDESATIRGVLYKHGTNDYEDQNTPGYFCDSTVFIPQWHDAWELTYPDDYAGGKAWAPLAEYYRNQKDFSYIESHFDYNNVLHYTLFVMALGISDNWGNKNQFWSVRNITKENWKFIISPWDLDTSLGGHYNGNYHDGIYNMEFTPEVVIHTAIMPFSSFFVHKNMKEDLKNLWLAYRESVLSPDSIAQRLYAYCDLFEGCGAWADQYNYWQTFKYKPQMIPDLRREVQLIIEWYQNHCDSMDKYFGIETTGINLVKEKDGGHGQYYDLNGNRYDYRPKGIYIHSGHKYIGR